MSIDAFQVLRAGEELLYTFDWSGAVAEPATIMSVSYTVPLPLVAWGQSEDLQNLTTDLGLRGAQHGQRYVVQATATLSSGEKVSQELVVQGMA